MAYNNSIPQPTDIISDSQSDILGNFAAIKTLIDVNHETFGSADEGKHKFVQMPIQGSGPTTAATEMALYTKNDAGGTPQLYVRRDTSGDEIEFTGSTSSQNGWTRLPSGILLKWGRTNPSGVGDSTVTLPTGASIPVFANVFTAFTSLYTTGAGVDVNSVVYLYSLTTTAFSLKTAIRDTGAGSIGSVLVDYLIIGN